MMRMIVVVALLLLLAGCATNRYYPVYVEGGGYYTTERVYSGSASGARYDSLFALGVYPWWVHSFYTPYYYPYTFSYYHPFYYPDYGPYHFAGWYPSWPYYAGYPGSYWNEWPYYRSHLRHFAGQGAVAPQQRLPGQVAPALPVRSPQVVDQQQRRVNGARAANRDDMYRRPSPKQPGGFIPGSKRVTAPVDAAQRSQGMTLPPSVSSPVRPAPSTAPSLGRSPAVRQSAPVTPAAASQPFGSQSGRLHRPPSERSPRERQQ
jgi:hypothetical protein